MRKWAKGAAGATLLTASFVALGAGPALADVTNGNGSVLGGNQVTAPLSIPVDVSGYSLAVLGLALAGCKGGTSVRGGQGYAGGVAADVDRRGHRSVHLVTAQDA